MKIRLSKHLHKPALLVAIEIHEIGVFGAAYAIGLIGGGWWWSSFIVLPFTIIPWLRKQPRGYLSHILCYLGFSEILGYPKLMTKDFEE
ncbi:MAG: hypothetical protein RPS47_17750 [Colwellia sp.]|jgi:hypothetical protein